MVSVINCFANYCLRLKKRWYWRTVDTIKLLKDIWSNDVLNFKKNRFMGVKIGPNFSKMAVEKSRRFAFFLVDFYHFLSQNGPIRIYRKTGPTKSTVLGPGPPPLEIVEIFRKLYIFNDFGVLNRALKTVSKIGIYALPPLKSEFYRCFINSRPFFSCGTVFY
jgi:hypothetical protein